MPALYKYQRYIEIGPNGVTLDFRNTQDENATPATLLAEIDGWRYVSVPDATVLPEQPPEINWTPVTLTPELREQLKRSRPITVAKGAVREKIEVEAGDLHDLVADSMRLCEFAIALSVRVSHEVLTGEPMEAGLREAYAARAGAVKEAMDTGALAMRSDSENPDKMLVRLMERYTRISKIVASDYQPTIDELLPH
jgi:hypothetical protein